MALPTFSLPSLPRFGGGAIASLRPPGWRGAVDFVRELVTPGGIVTKLPDRWRISAQPPAVSYVLFPPEEGGELDAREFKEQTRCAVLHIDDVPFAAGLVWIGPDMPVRSGFARRVARIEARSRPGADLVAVRASVDPTSVTDQFALGMTGSGHAFGQISLASLLADRLAPVRESPDPDAPPLIPISALALFRISESSSLWYLVSCEQGRIFPSMDVLTVNEDQALSLFRSFASRTSSQWRLIAPEFLREDFPRVEPISLFDILPGPVLPHHRLMTLHSHADPVVRRRTLLVGTGAAVVGTSSWLLYTGFATAMREQARERSRLEAQRRREEAARREAEAARLSIDPIAVAPWENVAVYSPADVYRACAEHLADAPYTWSQTKFSRSDFGRSDPLFGTSVLNFASCDVDVVRFRRVLDPPIAGAPPIAPIEQSSDPLPGGASWREAALESPTLVVALGDPLEPSEEETGDSDITPTEALAARSAQARSELERRQAERARVRRPLDLAFVQRAFSPALTQIRANLEALYPGGATVLPGAVHLEFQLRSRLLAWASQVVIIDFVLLPRDDAWTELLSSYPGLHVQSLNWQEGRWRLTLVLWGQTTIFEPLREKERQILRDRPGETSVSSGGT